MKKFSKFLASAALSAVLLVGFAPTTFAGMGAVNGSVFVNGQGVVSVRPDTATIAVTIETRAETSKLAQEKNSSDTKNLVKSLTALGIDSKDIQTGWFNIYPEYDYNEPNSRRVISYIANHSLNIIIRDLDNVTEAVDSITAMEGIYLNGVSYSLEDKTAALDEARMLAIKNAKEKITKLADTLGFSIGTLQSVSENSGYDYYGPVMNYDMRGNGMPSAIVNIAVDVSLSYEIH